VQGSTGSFNTGRRGELVRGDAGDRANDNARGRAEKARREKLNHERRVNRLSVNPAGDGAELR